MSDSQNPAPTGEAEQQPTGMPVAGASDPPNDPVNVDALAARLRRTEKALQLATQKAESYESDQAAKAQADMTALEKANAKNADLEAKLSKTLSLQSDTMKRSAFRHAVDKLGASNLDDALQLADLSSLEIDGDKIAGVDELARAFKKSKPYLFGAAPAATSSGGGNPPGGAPPKITPEQIKAMSREQFAEYSANFEKAKPFF